MPWSLRLITGAVWLVAVFITIAMLWEFTEAAGPVYLAVLLLAAALATIGIVVARATWPHRNYVSAGFGLTAWFIGAMILALMEWGFWQAKQEVVATAAETESMQAKGRLQLANQAQSGLEAYAGVPSSAEVVAKRNALLNTVVDQRYGRTLAQATRYCSNPGDYDAQCRAWLELDTLRTRAEQKEKLEKRVWDAATGPQVILKTLDISAAANSIASATGWSVKASRDCVVFFLVVLMFLARDGLLFLATAPRREDAKAGKTIKLTPIGNEVGALEPDVSIKPLAITSKVAEGETHNAASNAKAANVTQKAPKKAKEKKATALGSSPVYPTNNVVKGPFGAGKADALRAAVFALVKSKGPGEYAFRDLVEELDGFNESPRTSRFGLIKENVALRNPALGDIFKEAFGAASERKCGKAVYTKQKQPAASAGAA